MRTTAGVLLCCLLVMAGCGIRKKAKITGELKQWHRITLTFRGPAVSEYDEENPFLDYRLNVTFRNGERELTVPGFYAADGDAAETGAVSGNKWRVHFCPDKKGTWHYSVSFRKGKAISVNDDAEAGTPVSFNGAEGSFEISATDKTGRDFRGKGKLRYVGGRYLQFSETGDYFLKAGADSPENFLAYEDFDGTYANKNLVRRSGDNIPAGKLHRYAPHADDWHEGDPEWQDGKGKNIIGALNYLASKGMNSVYMLTMNVMGDGDDVWPWHDRNERYRFDCSKLDQWEIVFSHMDQLGIMMHFVTQETENQCLLDAGYTDVQRKLYFREMVARFSHHLAITWNLGEENGPADFSPVGQTDEQRKRAADFLKKTNPYNDMIVIHTHSSEPDRHQIIAPLTGFQGLDGLSVQVGSIYETHLQTFKWLNLSADSGKPWVVCLDEIGPASTGVKPDSADPDHDDVRKYALWSNLMAGGGGVEWYFGYNFPHNDLNCEDWRSRERMWDQSRYAVEFFQNHLPFWEMRSRDDATTNEKDYCLVLDGEIYAIYIPSSGTAELDLTEHEGEFDINWFNPRTGGTLELGTKDRIVGGLKSDIGFPPGDLEEDWIALVMLNGM